MMKLIRHALCLFGMLIVTASAGWAQSGKISGTVTDAATGNPLPGVNVVIVDQQLGATTDVEGNYTILNVPPGTYDVRASFVGFASVTQQNVEVDIDLTTEVNFELQEETEQLQEVVVQSERPVIQKDIAGSQQNIDTEEIQGAPYQEVEGVITSSVSVNSVDAYEDRPQIRGSSMDESLFIVDGMSQGDPLTNRPSYQVNLEAVQQIKIQTGGFSAEYGNLRSGLINVVTKEGGETYSGSFDLQYSPPALKHFGPMITGHESPIGRPMVDPAAGAFTGVDSEGNPNPIFEGWNNVATERLSPGDAHYGEPMELYARWLWRHRSQASIDELQRLNEEGQVNIEFIGDPEQYVFHEYGVRPDWNGSATLGGPVPFTNKRVRFFGSFSGLSREYAFRTAQPTYEDRHGRLKLTSYLTDNLKLNLNGFYSWELGSTRTGTNLTDQIASNPLHVSLGRGTFDTRKVWYPHCIVPMSNTRQIYGADLTHTLSSNTFWNLKLTHHRTDYERHVDQRETAPLGGVDPEGNALTSSETAPGISGGRIGTTEHAEAMAAAGTPGWENWKEWRRIQIGEHWYDEAPSGHAVANWKDVTNRYPMETCPMPYNNTYSRTYRMKGSITSQINPSNLVKAGFEVSYNHIYQYFKQIRPATNRDRLWLSNTKPWHGAVFVQDKLEYEGFVANVGLRADWRVTGAFPALNFDNPDGEVSGPYSDFLLAGNTTNEEGEIILDENIPEKRFFDIYLSPRLGISHPILTVAKLFFNFGVMYQWPDAYRMYRTRYEQYLGSRVGLYGNPRLEPPRTIAYELGYEHNLFDRMNLRLTGYYKDVNNEISSVQYFPLGGENYQTFRNGVYRDIRGLEGFLQLRRGSIPYVSGWASVNYMVRSRGQFGFDQFFEDPSEQPSQVPSQVTSPDVRPIIKLNGSLHTPTEFGPEVAGFSPLGGAELNLLYLWRRGPQFTWNPDNIPLVENNVRWTPYQRVDLRFRKNLFVGGGIESTFYIDVKNLFNHQNMTFWGDNSVGGRWAWDLHDWWNTEVQDYMYSLGYTPENENTDGSFENTIGDPGEYEADEIDMPAFSSWTFLEKRDIYFGLKLTF